MILSGRSLAGWVVATALAASLIGCARRQMTITSEPSGALVYLNDEEIGRTPLRRDFVWYGNYDVQVRHDGYHALDTHRQLTAPWWQWPPFDLFAEFMPFRPTDQQAMHFTLTPITPSDVDPSAMLARAAILREQLASPADRR